MSDWRRLSSWNATPATGAATLFALMTWMSERRRVAAALKRHLAEATQLATMGAVGALATQVYLMYGKFYPEGSRGFWDTAKYLLATYGAYEAYQIVRFNLEAFRAGVGNVDQFGSNYDGERLRRNSRLLLSSLYWSTGAKFTGPFSVSGVEELRPLLTVMAGALLAERLRLRRTLNKAPLQALGLLALVTEEPVGTR